VSDCVTGVIVYTKWFLSLRSYEFL
jgi:hypothetical protein